MKCNYQPSKPLSNKKLKEASRVLGPLLVKMMLGTLTNQQKGTQNNEQTRSEVMPND